MKFTKKDNLWIPKYLKNEKGFIPGVMPVIGPSGLTPPTTNLQLWWDTTTIVGHSEGDRLTGTVMVDLSGNTPNSDAHPAAGNGPIYRSSTKTINGLPVLEFDPSLFVPLTDETSLMTQYSPGYMDTGAWTAATMYIVGRSDNAVPPSNLYCALFRFEWASGGYTITTWPTDTGVFFGSFMCTAQKNMGSLGLAVNNPWYTGFFSTASDWRCRFNGSQVYGTATNTFEGFALSGGISGIYIGVGDPGNFYYDGVIGEVLVWDKVLDAGEIALVEAYLAAKWGI